MTAWYNEPDDFAAGTLRNLIAAGAIAPGVVDQRDIREVEAYELAQFTQCHFFAGVGVWSYAARRAGWRDDEPLWTGSCPCPPFSQAGKGQSCPACGGRRHICHPCKTGHFVCLSCGCDHHADDRHLWPEFSRIIRDGKPAIVAGEQVTSADGRIWLAAVSADMERMGYAVAASDLCAAGFGGAHIRQRNYFVGLADDDKQQRDGCRNARSRRRGELANFSAVSGLGHSDGERQDSIGSVRYGSQSEPEGGSAASGLADTDGCTNERSLARTEQWTISSPNARNGTECYAAHAPMLGRTPVDWLYCRDGKWRPVEPGTFPLVDATPSRVGRLRSYGNALDAETATQFLRAVRGIVTDDLRPVREYDL